MTNRTVQIYGQGYSAFYGDGVTLTPTTVTATFDGTQVFSGPVATIESPDVDRSPEAQVVLFTFEIPLEMDGYHSLDMEISNGSIFLEQIYANYVHKEDDTSSGPDTFLTIDGPRDPRTNVVCTGAVSCNYPPDPRPPGEDGAWGYAVQIAPGATATFNCTVGIIAGLLPA